MGLRLHLKLQRGSCILIMGKEKKRLEKAGDDSFNYE